MCIYKGVLLCLVALFLGLLSANSLIYQQNVSKSSVSTNNVDFERPNENASKQEKRQLIVRILALFTGSSTDLGLDHRLGRQVLKLAAARARRLSREVSDVQLLIYNDSSECKSGASDILGQVAQEFYTGRTQNDDADTCVASSPIVDSNNQEYALDGCDESRSSERRHLTDSVAALSRIDAILGPSCDHLIDSVARMAAYWRTPIYTVTSISGTFGRKDVYPTLTRLSPSIDHLSLFIMTVMERFKWRHLAIVVDHSQPENTGILANLEQTIARMRYTIPVDRKTFPFSSFTISTSNKTTEVEKQEADISPIGDDHQVAGQMHCTRESRQLLLSVRRVARVVLLLLNDPQVVRRLLLCAHELRFNNGEYTFLALNLGLKSSTSSKVAGSASGRQQQEQQQADKQTFDWFVEDDEANNLRARQMFESLMVFSVELPASNEYNIFVEQTLDLAQQEYPGAHFDHSSVGLLAVALHDSLLLAVEAQRRQFISYGAQVANESTRTRTTTPRSSGGESEEEDFEVKAEQINRREVPLLWNERYPYGLISGMHINANGDQELDYVLSDMEPELGLFRPVASYSKEARQIQMLPSSYIHWPARVNAATQQVLHNDEPPLDEPECGFTGDAQHCVDRQNLFTALAIVGSFLLCLMLIALVSFRRYRKIKYQMQLDDYWWKINWDDLEFLRAAQRNSLTSNLASSLVRQLRGTGTGGGLGHQSLVGSAVSSAAGRKSLASSDDGSHTHKQVFGSGGGGGNFAGAMGHPSAASISKRRSAVSLVVTPAVSGAGDGDEEGTGAAEKHAEAAHPENSLVAIKSSQFDGTHSSRIIRSEFSTVVRASSLALYKGEIVIVKQLNGNSIEISRDLLIELKGMRELSNENLARLIGLCLDPEHLSIVYEYCTRGNLQDLLLNTSINMDWNLKYSIIGDILNGLNFIHTTLLDYHGRLKSTNLVLDSRFTVKLTDFGLKSLYNQLDLIENKDEDDEGERDQQQHLGDATGGSGAGHLQSNDALASDPFRRQSMAPTIYNMDSVSMRAENFTSPNFLSSGGGGASNITGGTEARMRLKNRGSARFFWTAPEHLRNRQAHLAGSKRGDVYSMAIILYEIFTRKQPYHFGTNAKPRWQVIKRDKLRHQGQQQQQQQMGHQLMGPGAGLGGDQGASGGGSQLTGRGASFARKRGSRRSDQTTSVSQATSGSGLAHRKPSSGGASKPSSSILSRNRKRRSNASVGPMQQVAAAAAAAEGSAADGAESCVTHSSSSSVQRGHEPQPVAAPEQVKISVSAFKTSGEHETIGEDLEEEAEVSSIASHQQGQEAASKRKMSATSCLSLELKTGTGAARLKSKAATTATDSEGQLDAEEILDQLRMGIQPEPVRPYIPNYLLQDIDPRMMSLLRSCWHEQPSVRPTVNHVRNTMRKITKGATAKNYLDNLLDRLQTYASQLEVIVDSKSADIMAEKARTEELLYQLVPRFVADKLKRSEPIIPQVFDGVTIFFSDIVGFEKYASVMSPCELVDLLNNIYSSFESIISSFDVTKIEVILDQFLVASGISLQQQQEHHATSGGAEQPAEGADGATTEQAAATTAPLGGEKAKLAKPKRRILGALRGGNGSQSLEDSKRGPRQEDPGQEQQSSNAAPTETRGGTLDLSHYNRASCEQIARMALCIRDLVKSLHFRQNLNSIQQASASAQDAVDATGSGQKQAGGSSGFVASNFNIRIGIHSGKVCAGIVGVKRPKFCLIGDTVNVASRMHTNSKANRIQISASTRELLKQVPGFAIEPRGRIEIKGKGMMETFWLESSY